MENCCVSQARFRDYKKCFCEERSDEAISSFSGCKIATPSLMARNDTCARLSIFESNVWDSNFLSHPAASGQTGTIRRFQDYRFEDSSIFESFNLRIFESNPQGRFRDASAGLLKRLQDYKQCLCEERSDEAISSFTGYKITTTASQSRNDTLFYLASSNRGGFAVQKPAKQNDSEITDYRFEDFSILESFNPRILESN